MSTAPPPETASATVRGTGVAKHFDGEAAGRWFGNVADELFVKLLGRHATSFAKLALDHAAYFGGNPG